MEVSPFVLTDGEARVEPKVIVDGIVSEIRLDPRDAILIDVVDSGNNRHLVLTFFGARYFVNFYDHRKIVVDAYNTGGLDGLTKAFGDTTSNGGTFGRYAITKCQYFALADGNDPLNIIKPDYRGIILIRGSRIDRNKLSLRIINSSAGDALHQGTGICFCERRPPREPKN